MANIEKFTRQEANLILRHILRQPKIYKNKDIDLDKSENNIYLVKRGYEYYKQRLSEVFCQNRKDVNTLIGVVITLPQELNYLNEPSQDELLSFASLYFVKKFGEKNTINVAIHRDEKGQPHIHCTFIPVVEDERRGEKVCAKKILTRHYLQKMHLELANFINNILKSEYNKHNTDEPLGDYFYSGITKQNGKNFSIDELKNGELQNLKITKLQEKINNFKSEIENLRFENRNKEELIHSLNNENHKLKEQISDLQEKLNEFEKSISQTKWRHYDEEYSF